MAAIAVVHHAIAWIVETRMLEDGTEQAELVVVLNRKRYPTGLNGTPDEIGHWMAKLPLSVAALIVARPKIGEGK